MFFISFSLYLITMRRGLSLETVMFMWNNEGNNQVGFLKIVVNSLEMMVE